MAISFSKACLVLPRLWPSILLHPLWMQNSAEYSLPGPLPADVIGTLIYSQRANSSRSKMAPSLPTSYLQTDQPFTCKVQSALLEAMQERQVTMVMTVSPLPQPFLVMATQNPLSRRGTYPLLEAQVVRFMLKVVVSYPKGGGEAHYSYEQFRYFPETLHSAQTRGYCSCPRGGQGCIYGRKIEKYIVDIVFATVILKNIICLNSRI